MVTVSDPKASLIADRKAALVALQSRCKDAGVTHDDIAAKRKCGRPFVVNVFAGRRPAPDGFVDAVETLCDRAERRAKRKAS